MAAKVLPHKVLGQTVAQPSLHVIQGKDRPCQLNSRISKATIFFKMACLHIDQILLKDIHDFSFKTYI